MEDEEEHVTVEWALEGEHEEDEEASASGHERDGICSDREGDGRDGGVGIRRQRQHHGLGHVPSCFGT